MSSVEQRARELWADWHRQRGCGQQIIDDCLSGVIQMDGLTRSLVHAALREQPEARGVVDDAMVERARQAYMATKRWGTGEYPEGPIRSVADLNRNDDDAWRAALTAAQQPVQEGGGEGLGEGGRYWRERAEFWRSQAVALGWRERRDAENGEAAPPSAPVGVEAAEAMGATGGPASEPERLAFEAWMRGHCWALCATWDGTAYRSDAEQGGRYCADAARTRMLWAAWRDRAALPQQPAQAAPGWKLVPVVATPEMMEAATGLFKSVGLYGCYNAMLAAAPTPPGDDAAGGGHD